MRKDKKVCSRCGEEKSLSKFSKDSRTKDNRRCWCKECFHQYYLKNKEYLLLQSKKWSEVEGLLEIQESRRVEALA